MYVTTPLQLHSLRRRVESNVQSNRTCHRIWNWMLETNQHSYNVQTMLWNLLGKCISLFDSRWCHWIFFIDIRGWSEKFCASTIDDNNIGKIFFLSW